MADFMGGIRDESPVCLIIVTVFIGLAALTLMNMLIGVLCEVITAMAAEEKEQLLTVAALEQIHDIVKKLDLDDDRKISYDEFRQLLQMPSVLKALSDVGVDPIGLVDLAEHIFVVNGQTVDLDFEQFMEFVLDLRGSNTATVKDLTNLSKQNNGLFNRMMAELQAVKAQLRGLSNCTEDKGDKEDKESASAAILELKEQTARIEQQLQKDSEKAAQTERDLKERAEKFERELSDRTARLEEELKTSTTQLKTTTGRIEKQLAVLIDEIRNQGKKQLE
eukprot:gnl/TRDRNA2_/TRDRNA2_157920_c2_seq1.p1 gnl/TRDRNA2_/TRDRNA2_157920_c2~~gnl/TRDRNA2_/TRDRNA2_157920_c2_seq1.p1  ORF type:complete len:308 (+),score=90.25 gnl/TRDRNA2_/TRDRNA2_157920_c2_seq1:93-926(+)